MKSTSAVLVTVLVLVASLLLLAMAVAFGGPKAPLPMASINDPFKSIDFSDLPRISRYRAEDGQDLAFREYAPTGALRGSVTLIHGSSASSNSLHPLAKGLSAAGYKVYSIDVRGHGESGPKGHIDYIGQLESDLAAFVRFVRPPAPSTLAGFSAGGGFVLRFAGSSYAASFQSYLALSPFLSQDAQNQRPGSGGWANVGIPRIVALSILNTIGIRAFNALPVTSFALNERARSLLTPEYDFNLATNFRPERDYLANLRRVAQPVAALVGASDEAFYADKLQEIFRAAGKSWEVDVLPGIGHIPLTLAPAAIEAVIRRVVQLQHPA